MAERFCTSMASSEETWSHAQADHQLPTAYYRPSPPRQKPTIDPPLAISEEIRCQGPAYYRLWTANHRPPFFPRQQRRNLEPRPSRPSTLDFRPSPATSKPTMDPRPRTFDPPRHVQAD